MNVIVTDTGFSAAIPVDGIVNLAEIAHHSGAVDLGPADDPDLLEPFLANLSLIRVAFPAFSDGRGFTIGRRLRTMGYTGKLRALGHVLADQYAMARRVGFDEVEITEEMAARQPQDQWQFRADWRAHDYQSRLRA